MQDTETWRVYPLIAKENTTNIQTYLNTMLYCVN